MQTSSAVNGSPSIVVTYKKVLDFTVTTPNFRMLLFKEFSCLHPQRERRSLIMFVTKCVYLNLNQLLASDVPILISIKEFESFLDFGADKFLARYLR